MDAWRFLLDENIDPRTLNYLEGDDVDVEHVGDALGYGADDVAEILPYARERDRIVVTSDVSDFGALGQHDHAGVILVYDDTMSGISIAAGLRAMIDTYGEPDQFVGREVLDDWA
jgi:predicted nuclease of predicted toxin-antitoxin system